MNQVYWDSMLFIYLLEGNPQYVKHVERLLRQIEATGDQLATSVFTLGEVLTGPRKAGATAVVSQIKSYFESGRILILPFDLVTADMYGVLRSSLKLSQADAIHMATAAVAQVDIFFTNDNRLLKLQVPGIRFISDLNGKIYSKYQP
jgi:predicted nucleic acid-binding protein